MVIQRTIPPVVVCALVVLSTVCEFSPAFAQSPYLVSDINVVGLGSSPTEVADFGGFGFFAADDGVSGVELWRSDGSGAGTVRVKDICPGVCSSSPSDLRVVGTTLFFVADNGVTGRELWKSDGTSGGTVLVKDIYLGITSSGLAQFAVANGVLMFRANGGSGGIELWKSDGTSGGTVLVKDIWSGSTSSVPTSLTAVGSTVFFRANNGSQGHELWKSDGTAGGTVLVKDIYAGSISSAPGGLTAVGSTLYFTANGGGAGTELWKSNGNGRWGRYRSMTSARATPHRCQSAGPHIRELHALFHGGTMASPGRELWKTNGTSGGNRTGASDIRSGSLSSASGASNLTALGIDAVPSPRTTALTGSRVVEEHRHTLQRHDLWSRRYRIGGQPLRLHRTNLIGGRNSCLILQRG